MTGTIGTAIARAGNGSPVRILAVVAALTLMPACELVIEYDYVGEPAPLTSTTYSLGSGETRSIAGLYETVGFDEVKIYVEPVESNAANYDPCITDDFLDANFKAIENHRPSSFQGIWRWYAHGLMVDKVCSDLEGAGKASGFQGALWFPPPVCVGNACDPRPRTREKFLVVRDSVQNDSDMHVRVAVHELTHVFNLHHCDLNADDVDSYPTGFEKNGPNGRCLTHMNKHKDSHESYVKPGPEQEPFCGESLQMPADHETMHADEDVKGTAECAKSSCATLSALLKAPVAAPLSLTLEPEKQSFAPGEPVMLRVVLDTENETSSGASYYGERSLDPQLRQLRIWAGTNEDDLQPLDPLLMFCTELDWIPLPGRVEASGLDAWFLLPFDLKTTQDTLYAQATFSVADRVARTEVVEVAVNRHPPTEPPDPDVLELFTHPESRRFLYFLGGDHLEQGRDKLEQVASVSQGTVYGTYADLALGVSLALPFQHFDKKAGKLLTRPADPVAARLHLDRAHPLLDQLPPTRQRSLVQVRGLVYESLGDEAAPTDPRAAIELYRVALEMFRALPDLPRPLMMTHVEYDAKIDEQVRRVHQKLVQLPAPGQV